MANKNMEDAMKKRKTRTANNDDYKLVDARKVKEDAYRKNPRLKALAEKAKPAYDAINEFIRLRNENKITQKELEELTQIQQASISRFESGRMPNFTFDYIAKLVKPIGYRPRIVFEKI
jgi:DNA-binding Xre family transcriptional regulator